MMIKYVFFDVSGTLLGKPSLYTKIADTLLLFDYLISIEEIKYKHKLLSEVIHFPDRTDKEFYRKFNTELLYLLGISPKKELVEAIFNNCSYLPWEKFADTDILTQLQ